MKAILLLNHGGPEMLRYGEAPDPAAGPGEVVADIHAASVNAADCKVRLGGGRYSLSQFPHILGRDFSGVVSTVGSGVIDFAVGDAVFGVTEQGIEGAYAEKIAIKASIIAKKPDALSHAEAAALGLTSLTALTAIEDTEFHGELMMDVLEAVASRYSCRAFLPTPVPEKTVREIVERAARAPSAGNMQPWRVYAVAGRRIDELKAMMAPRMATELPKGEGTDYTIYPEPLTEPYRSRRFMVGELLYQSIDVSREDKSSRYKQYSRNYQFFGAPVALFFARERAHGPAQWADIGGYLQTVALLARGFGLHTCPQQAWVSFHRTVRVFLRLPDNLMIYSGLALGYEDAAAPINAWRSPREPLDQYASFEGFDK